MKHTHLFAVIGLLAVCAFVYLYAPVMDREFISRSPLTCSEISYTCPQYQTAFSTGLACGCAPTDTHEDDPDQRTLQGLIERHLAARMARPTDEGEIFTSVVQLGLSELPNGLFAFDVLLGATEYADREGILVKIREHFMPAHVVFEETGRSYIIRSEQLFDLDTADIESALAETFDAEQTAWLLDDAETAARLDVEAQLMQQNKIKGIQQLKVGPAVDMPLADTEAEA